MTLSYDGHDLESLFICGEPELSILNSQPELMESSARDGSVFIGMKYGTSTVSFTIAATGTAAERRDKFSTLGSWLKVDSPKQLILPDTPDRYYLAIPNGALDLQRGFDGEYAKLTFTLTDPIAYSVTENTVNASGANVATFTVGGTAPTSVVIESSNAYSAGKWWRVNAESTASTADYVNMYIGETATSSSTATSLRIDCVNHTCWVQNVSNPRLDLDSTWFMFEPGEHKLYGRSSGNFTVKWRDRWY